MSSRSRIAQEAERREILTLLTQAFNAKQYQLEHIREAPIEQFRVAGDGSRVHATLRVVPTAQWFGGRSVRSGAVTAVAVRPESRGRGLVQELLGEALIGAHEAGFPLSVLYPSTLPTYRRAGYELAGTRTRYHVPISAIRREAGPTAFEWDDGAISLVMRCYSSYAARWNGLIDRSTEWWNEYVLAPPHESGLYRYMVTEKGDVTGYLVFALESKPDPVLPLHNLLCRDLVWTDRNALQGLLSILGAHSVLGVDASWYGPPAEPMSIGFDVPVLPQSTYYWMLRLVDVHAALAARGYPMAASGSVVFDVQDPLLQHNRRSFRLTVDRGQAEVSESPSSPMHIDVAALACIYSGWLPARAFVEAGRLTGATAQDLDTFDALFRDVSPWLIDWF